MSCVSMGIKGGALAAALVVTLGCGGGGGGQSNSISTPPSMPTELKVNLTSGSPNWAAYQDGSGAWISITLASGVTTIPIHDPSGRFGFAYGFTNSTGDKVATIWQANLNERPGFSLNLRPVTPVTVAIPVTGLGSNDKASACFGSSYSVLLSTQSETTLQCAPGTADLVLVGKGFYGSTIGAKVVRGQTYPADTTLPTQDLATLSPLVNANIAITGAVPGTSIYLYGDWSTAGGTFASSMGDGFTTTSSGVLPIVPSSMLVAGDLQDAMAADWGDAYSRYAYTYFQNPTGVSVVLPPALSGTVGFTSGRPYAQWTAISGSRWYLGDFSQPSTQVRVKVNVTPGWLGGASTQSYTMPDLSAVSGPGWTFTSGDTVRAYFLAIGTTSWFKSDGTIPPSKDGDREWYSEMHGSIIPAAGGASGFAPLVAPEVPRGDDSTDAFENRIGLGRIRRQSRLTFIRPTAVRIR